MSKMKVFSASLIALFIIAGLLLTGCQTAPAAMDIPPDPFVTTFSLGDGGKFSISGNSAGHVSGGQSEFLLKLDNRSGKESWQDEYCIILVDEEGVVKEVTHEQFNIPAGLETQTTIVVDFPERIEGPLGLGVVIPQRGATISTLSIGVSNAISTGWPDIHTCPLYLTEEGSRKLAEKFVRSSPTFVFDGIEDTLELLETLYPDTENTWQFVYHFESRHDGYGDRTGQVLSQVITSHEAIITVGQGGIVTAIMDEKWDMINQQMQEGVDISLAPIEEVEVRFMESFPVQVGVYIKGGLRDGCTIFNDLAVKREGDVINIQVTTKRPEGEVCIPVYSFFEKNVNLGSSFTSGATYTLNVNDFTTTFKMP